MILHGTIRNDDNKGLACVSQNSRRLQGPKAIFEVQPLSSGDFSLKTSAKLFPGLWFAGKHAAGVTGPGPRGLWKIPGPHVSNNYKERVEKILLNLSSYEKSWKFRLRDMAKLGFY